MTVPAASPGTTVRGAFVLLHRWAGLAIAGFLFVAGVTGSVIAFHHELDALLNPNLFRAASPGPPLSPSALVAAAERSDPRLRVSFLPLDSGPGESVGIFVQGRIDLSTGKPSVLGYSQLFLDPVTGEPLGTRQFGACCLERQNLIPFLYRLHYTLHLPRPWGDWLMGGIALIWILDCFVGAYLTLPRGRPFWHKWSPAWRVKRGAGSYRLNLDLHRAGGLWLWIALLAVAVSGAYLNLTNEVFRPLVSVFSPLKPTPVEQAKERFRSKPTEPRVTYDEAVARAMREGVSLGWRVTPASVFHTPHFGSYGVGLMPTAGDQLGTARIYLDDQDGRVLRTDYPGEGSTGDIFLQLQFPLHSGKIAGLPGRIVICVTGLVVAMLSVTGIVIWSRKRRARIRQA